MRVRPTRYTLWTVDLKSWIVEGSVDGDSWTEIDRQTDNGVFESRWSHMCSFAVSALTDCRFIRLIQTDKGYDKENSLTFRAVEFFGELSE
jgi:hypothetical protein